MKKLRSITFKIKKGDGRSFGKEGGEIVIGEKK